MKFIVPPLESVVNDGHTRCRCTEHLYTCLGYVLTYVQVKLHVKVFFLGQTEI